MFHAEGTSRTMRNQDWGMPGVFKDCQDRMSKRCDGKGPWGQIIFHFVGFYKDSGF